jgi:hypothetical protein
MRRERTNFLSSHLFFITQKIMTRTILEPRIALLDQNGIYIPQLYCNHIDEKIAKEMNIPMEDVLICQSGPDHEWYWESWNAIISNAEWIEDGVKWGLHQDGDLWEVPEGFSFDEEV